MAAVTALAVGTAITAAFAPAPVALAAGGCTQTYRFFYVTHLSLHDTVSAHFVDTDNPTTTIDTVQQANVSESVPKPPASARRKSREIAFFFALISGCRVGDYNLGFLNRTVSVPSALRGTWSTTGRTGKCGQTGVLKPSFDGTFMRPTRSRKFYPPPSRTRLELSLTPHGRLDCQFQFLRDDGVSYGNSGLGNYTLTSYRTVGSVVPTAPLLKGAVVKIPFHLSGHSNGIWRHGRVSSTADAKGTLTLTRYKSCTMTPQTPLTFFCLP